MDTDSRLFLQVPAPEELVRAANDHARALYGADALAWDEMSCWLMKNQFIIAVLRTEAGQYCGYFDILPITEEAATLIRDLGLNERAITPDMILPPPDMNKAQTLYLASVVVKDSGTKAGRTRADYLLSGLVRYMRRYYSGRPIRILAIAATALGRGLLKRLCATEIRGAASRRDRHEFYEFQWTETLEDQILKQRRGRLAPEEVELIETAKPGY